MALDVDVAGIEEGKQTAGAHPFQILVVGHLHFVHQIDDFIEIFYVSRPRAWLLHTAVEVDGEHDFEPVETPAGNRRL